MFLGLSFPDVLQCSERPVSVPPGGCVLRVRADFGNVPDGRVDSKVWFGHRALDSPLQGSAGTWHFHDMHEGLTNLRSWREPVHCGKPDLRKIYLPILDVLPADGDLCALRRWTELATSVGNDYSVMLRCSGVNE